MIDIHCHLLPGIDDGAPDLEAALSLARAAVDNGIRHAVLTPHVYPGRWDNTRDSLAPVFAEFQRALREAQIPLQTSLGGELHLLAESLAWLADDRVPFLGHWFERPVVLLEMPDGMIPVGALRATEHLLNRGFVPMIAHPERNKDVMRGIERVEPFLQQGCLLQLTAASVCGRFGQYAHRTALELLDADWVFAVATDAHNLAHRPPILAEARDAIGERYGAEAAFILTERNPGALLERRPPAWAVEAAGGAPEGQPRSA